MDITCISDLHGNYPELEGGDLLIIAGDLTARNKVDEYFVLRDWIRSLDYKKIILIAGNHDGCIESGKFSFSDEGLGVTYLQDSGIEFEGLKIWGSPWTPEFCGWHFMLPRGPKIKEKWDLIPDDTDILITHGPPYGVLDVVYNDYGRDPKQGCMDLRDVLDRVKPKLHVFGHIHESHGRLLYKHEGPNTICVNASIMDENYNPNNKPMRVIL